MLLVASYDFTGSVIVQCNERNCFRAELSRALHQDQAFVRHLLHHWGKHSQTGRSTIANWRYKAELSRRRREKILFVFFL
jgi:hypothetical protein